MLQVMGSQRVGHDRVTELKKELMTTTLVDLKIITSDNYKEARYQNVHTIYRKF